MPAPASCERILIPIFPSLPRQRANQLRGIQPFTALQSIGLSRDVRGRLSLEEIATTYVNSILEVQKSGPYFLGGWSFGGVVAYEMARQLIKLGKNVEPVILIDSPAPYSRPIPSDRYLSDWLLKDYGSSFSELEQKQQKKLFEIFRVNITALSEYSPPLTNIPVILLKAATISMDELWSAPLQLEGFPGSCMTGLIPCLSS